MIPILFEKDETQFTSNGICRLRDCISCTVTEERNGIYECDFEYPIDGANFEMIQCGRIIGVTHDETDDLQPFDIVSYTKPLNGVVSFHAVHLSYRNRYLTVYDLGNNSYDSINSVFNIVFKNYVTPENPFTYVSDFNEQFYLGSIHSGPISVRQVLGGVEGSILDVYGGEYEWDKWTVALHKSRGQLRDFSIRYGVNMTEFNDEMDYDGTYTSCIPYWTDGTTYVEGDKVVSGGASNTGRDHCVPLNLSDKFETQPTKAQVESMAISYMKSNKPYAPKQNIHVEFIRLQDVTENAGFQNLLQCSLCDTINVIFPAYNMSSTFKIVKVVWNVLRDRYVSMDLGDLSTSLSDALGISSDGMTSSSITTAKTENGTRVESVPTTGVAVASSGSWTSSTLATSVTLKTGVWSVVYGAQFAANNAGYRMAYLGTEAAASSVSGDRYAASQTAMANSSASTRIQSSKIVNVTDESATYNLFLVQNSGSQLTAYPYISAVQIR